MDQRYEQIAGTEIIASVTNGTDVTVATHPTMLAFAGAAAGIYLAAISGDLYETKGISPSAGGVPIAEGTGAAFFGDILDVKWSSQSGAATYYATLLARIP